MIKTKRKGAIVKYCGNDEDLKKTWGELFEVFHKEGDFLRVSSLKKPHFGIVAVIPEKECEVVENSN